MVRVIRRRTTRTSRYHRTLREGDGAGASPERVRPEARGERSDRQHDDGDVHAGRDATVRQNAVGPGQGSRQRDRRGRHARYQHGEGRGLHAEDDSRTVFSQTTMSRGRGRFPNISRRLAFRSTTPTRSRYRCIIRRSQKCPSDAGGGSILCAVRHILQYLK